MTRLEYSRPIVSFRMVETTGIYTLKKFINWVIHFFRLHLVTKFIYDFYLSVVDAQVHLNTFHMYFVQLLHFIYTGYPEQPKSNDYYMYCKILIFFLNI